MKYTKNIRSRSLTFLLVIGLPIAIVFFSGEPWADNPSVPAGSIGGIVQSAAATTDLATVAGHTEPVVIQTGRANTWSTIAYFDLTDEKDIPAHAVVTKITLTGDSSGGFATPRRAIVDEGGERFYVNSFTNETKEHNGKLVRQRWAVQFLTSSIWEGPAMLRPVVNIHYAY